jgi:hypothetical protein
MFRKYLFLALTGMLVSVVVYLVVESRKIEPPTAPRRPVEIVRQSHPTATRAIAPPDLSVAGCALNDGGVEVRISNAGTIGYRNVMLQISFEGRKAGAPLNYVVSDTIGAGATVPVSIQGLEIPPAAARCGARILYADVLSK